VAAPPEGQTEMQKLQADVAALQTNVQALHADPPDATFTDPKEFATSQVSELFKLLPPTAGIMIALIWGLAASKDSLPGRVLDAMQVGAALLLACIVLALLGMQFMVTAIHRNIKNMERKDVSHDGAVATCFFLSWIAFGLGSIGVVWSLFQL
jgi:hypothetical protein